MNGYVGFHAALRRSYGRFVQDLARQCKQLLRHHLDSVTSPYSQVCYENEMFQNFGSGLSSISRFNQVSAGSYCLELSDGPPPLENDILKDQENIPPENIGQETTPGKAAEGREALRDTHMTVPETPSPDLPRDGNFAVKKELGNCIEMGGARKRQSRVTVHNRNSDNLRGQNNGSILFGNGDIVSRSGSAYSEICSSAAQHFARIREVLVERSVTSTLNSGFLTPW